jgi:predicted DNA-binding ribbon-helix-helix protein
MFQIERVTSVSVEDEFWAGLREIAKGRGQPIPN